MQSELAPYKCKAWLEQKYCKEGLSTITIGKMCGVVNTTIRRALIRFGIERRPPNRHQEYFSETSFLQTRASKDFCRKVREFSIQKELSVTELIQIALAEHMTRNGKCPYREE